MHKTVFIIAILCTLLACNNKNKAEVQSTSSYEISTEKWPKKAKLNSKSQTIVNDWLEFSALQTSLEGLKEVSNTEDLSLVLEDLIEKQKELKASKHPEAFNIPKIKSRQKVFHTYLLKAKGDLIYSIDAETSIVQMLEAYNAIIDQMNIITSNTLDLEKLLEEE